MSIFVLNIIVFMCLNFLLFCVFYFVVSKALRDLIDASEKLDDLRADQSRIESKIRDMKFREGDQ